MPYNRNENIFDSGITRTYIYENRFFITTKFEIESLKHL